MNLAEEVEYFKLKAAQWKALHDHRWRITLEKFPNVFCFTPKYYVRGRSGFTIVSGGFDTIDEALDATFLKYPSKLFQ